MSGPVTRYKFYRDYFSDACGCDMDVNDQGQWVEYSEYKMLLDKYDALVAHLNDRPDYMKRNY